MRKELPLHTKENMMLLIIFNKKLKKHQISPHVNHRTVADLMDSLEMLLVNVVDTK